MKFRSLTSVFLVLPALCLLSGWQPVTIHAAEPFTQINAYVPLENGTAAWGDYDNDGYLDLAVTGSTNAAPYFTQIWHNNHNNTFTNISTTLGQIAKGAIAWADLNNDGYLDLIVTGQKTGGISTFTELWENLGGTNFVKMANSLQSGSLGSIAIGDFDNDGLLDIVISGLNGNVTNRIYRNMGSFGFNSAGMPEIDNPGVGFAQFVDLDNDGWLDLFAAGSGYTNINIFSRVYRNLNGMAVTNVQNLTRTDKARGQFADFNNDGRLDLIIVGPLVSSNSPAGTNAHMWLNTGADLAESDATFELAKSANVPAVAPGDYDNDGWPDILLDWASGGQSASVYRNLGNNTFSNIHAAIYLNFGNDVEIPGAWGDFNNDGKLDLMVDEFDSSIGATAFSLYLNNAAVSNTPPTAPSGLSFEFAPEGTNVTLRWLAASDAQTPVPGLSYNIRVGTTPGGCDVVSPMADAVTGQRRLPALGNAELRRFAYMRDLELGKTYYWSVQAIDSGFAGGAWAPESSFTTRVPVIGDTNGDGIVSQSELDVVLSHYWPTSPWLAMTNPVGLGGTNVQFGLAGYNAWNFTVEYSTNLTDWSALGTATPGYQFNDPAGTNGTRFYRLRWP